MTQETFTPGMVIRKIAAFSLGIAVMSFGLFWMRHPLTLAISGGTATAQVVCVEMEKPGQEVVRLTTRKEVADAEDPTRNAVFSYIIRYTTQSGEPVEARLNYGQVVRPRLSITDPVKINYSKENPTDLIEAWSVRTYGFGVFFLIIGLMISITQAILLKNARKPIVIDPIQAMAGGPKKADQ
jgi:hypothetical protein